MRKSLLTIIAGMCSIATTYAQLSKAGIPLAQQYKLQEDFVPLQQYHAPDYESLILAREKAERLTGDVQPYLVAKGVPVDLAFPASGFFTKTEEGKQVWRASIEIPGARALGFCFDRFHLPEGVKLFVTNKNSSQILGAYTASNNKPSGVFAHEPVQGDRVYLEMDIDPAVNIKDITLHANKVAYYFRGVDYLLQYQKEDGNPVLLDYYDSVFTGQSSICMIDALCPLGVKYFNEQRANLSIVIPDENNENFGMCSATMINSMTNAAGACRNFLITASHCDYANSTDKHRFDQALFRFNYVQPSCNAVGTVEANTLLGAEFVARSELDTVNFVIKGDFLLLDLSENIPLEWNVTLAGWNRDSTIARQTVAPEKFISFHHPFADVQKVSAGHLITPDIFTPGVTEMTHWRLDFDSGYVDAGSSGAGLFNGAGYLIGNLTGAKNATIIESCNYTANGDTGQMTMKKESYYSRLSYNWDNNIAIDKKLQPWLDPLQTGVLSLKGFKSNCTALDSVNTLSINNTPLENGIMVYPNPSSDGQIHIRFNLQHQSDITIDLFNISGKRVRSFKRPGIRAEVYSLDTGALADGVYLLRIADGRFVANKKIVIARGR